MSSREKCLFKSSVHFLIRVFVFVIVLIESYEFFIYFGLGPYRRHCLQIYFPICMGVSLSLRSFSLVPMFSSMHFIDSSLIFRLLIYFELISVW